MKEEDKELLLVDLCARLPYGVTVEIISYGQENLKPWVGKLYCKDLDCFIHDIAYKSVKPYLRPMSSMTEEELEELNTLTYHNISVQDNALCGYICSGELVDVFDWLNSHHFDYRELIPKGLAIEVTEENNPYKD